jgi:hypothetical protein
VQSAKGSKNPYNTPQLNRLAFEQAAVFLVGHAYNNGDREAHTLLDVMFPDASTRNVVWKKRLRPMMRIGECSMQNEVLQARL